MCSLFLRTAAALLILSTAVQARELRVCADPDNLPFSNKQKQGFENRILALLAEHMGDDLLYVWTDERRATAVEVMKQGRCDLVPGMIAGIAGVTTTRPYMRSSYAFVTRGEAVTGFDDPRLHGLKIGVQSVGDDAVTPPVEALLHRGLRANLQPFTFHGNASDQNSAGAIVNAVAKSEIDAAVLWGPFAGYFASQQSSPLKVQIAASRPTDPQMSYDIGMATRPGDTALRDDVDKVLFARKREITEILAQYHVPLLPLSDVGVAP